MNNRYTTVHVLHINSHLTMSHRYLILGLLTEQPMSGYDIKKRVQTALGAVTNASYGTLYPTLHKLLAEGAVEMQEIPQIGRPSKKVYRITEHGQRELHTWLRHAANADQVRREFLLKLYLARQLDAAAVRGLLRSRRQETEHTLDALRTERELAANREQRWVIDYALTQCEMELAWLDRIEAEIDQV